MNSIVRVDVSIARSTIRYAARQALRRNLYEDESWMFYSILQNPDSIIKIATAIVECRRVGISILWDYSKLPDYADWHGEKQIGCFVRPEFRRQRIGSMLVNRMNVKNDIPHGTGVSGSRDFWELVRPEAD